MVTQLPGSTIKYNFYQQTITFNRPMQILIKENDAIQTPGKSKLFYVAVISLITALGGLLFGFDIAIISGTIPFIKPYFELNGLMLGWTVSSLHVGCILGTIFTGIISEKLGRKIPLIIASLLFAISSLGAALAYDLSVLILWRMIAGLAVGAASMLAPMYIAEIAPATYRGKFVTFNQLTIILGMLLAYFSNYILSDIENNWRWMFATGAVPAVLFFILLLFVPESPRWLLTKKKDSNALKVLEQIGDKEYALHEYSEIKKNLVIDQSFNLSLLKKRKYLSLLIIGITLAVLQQFSGINIIFFYAPEIFEKSGFATNDSLFQTVIIGVVNVVFTILSIGLIEKVGRKWLLVSGSFVMAIFLFGIAYSFYAELNKEYIMIYLILGYVAAFDLTLGPVVWVVLSEIFPNKLRNIYLSIATSFLWFSCFIVSFSFPILMENLNAYITFLLFGILCVASGLFCLKFIKETKGKSLEEIEKIYLENEH